jgi:hypothetical protein
MPPHNILFMGLRTPEHFIAIGEALLRSAGCNLFERDLVAHSNLGFQSTLAKSNVRIAWIPRVAQKECAE